MTTNLVAQGFDLLFDRLLLAQRRCSELLRELSPSGFSALKGGRMGFYSTHGISIVNAFSAVGTFIIFEVGHDIR